MTKTKTAAERTIRRATCDWEFNGAKLGEVETKEIEFFFFSPSIAELKGRYRQVEGAEPTKDEYWSSFYLAKTLHSIPAFSIGKGFDKSVTVDWLDEQDLTNVTHLREAIDEVISPKSKPETPQNG